MLLSQASDTMNRNDVMNPRHDQHEVHNKVSIADGSSYINGSLLEVMKLTADVTKEADLMPDGNEIVHEYEVRVIA